jgi:hypothetical protein
MISLSSGSLILIKRVLLFNFLLISTSAHSQNEKKYSNHLLNTGVDSFSNSSGNAHANTPIEQIDSIANTNGIAKPFANIYRQIMKKINEQIQGMNSDVKIFITNFEISFAEYFLNPYFKNEQGVLSPLSEWKCFFSHPEVEPWQNVLLGVNAHTNEDIWRALADNFSEKEIRHYKKPMLLVERSIAKVYRPFFDEIMRQKKYLRFINSFTKGFAKFLGERLVYKWRKRNVNLAILYYHNPEKFKKKLAMIHRKKQKTDQIILRKGSHSNLSK